MVIGEKWVEVDIFDRKKNIVLFAWDHFPGAKIASNPASNFSIFETFILKAICGIFQQLLS